MSEYTDDILQGIFCFTCGSFISPEAVGYPRNCESCPSIEEEEDLV